MQTHELRYFLATARTLNFTKAASQCGISQPALTRAIKKLENELGGPLFHRRPGHVELTRLGRTLLPRLEEIERGLADVQSQATALVDVAQGAEGNPLRGQWHAGTRRSRITRGLKVRGHLPGQHLDEARTIHPNRLPLVEGGFHAD